MSLLNKCYDVSYRDKYYSVVQSFVGNDMIREKDKLESEAIKTSSGSLVYMNKKLKNTIMYLSYNKSNLFYNVRDLVNLKGSINTEPLSIDFLKYDRQSVRMESIQISKVYPSDTSFYYRVDLVLEIALEKSVAYDDVPNLDTYFIHPILNKRVPIQYTIEPSVYLNNPSKYKNAIEIANGYGFYSIDKPELNVVDPIPINREGNIDLSGVITFNRVYDAKVMDWHILDIPNSL